MSARAAIDEATVLTVGPELADAAAAAVLAHGRGGAAADMARMATRLDASSVRFLLPQAPGGTWYPNRFMAPVADNEPALSQALATYAGLVDGLIDQGFAPENIIVGGFSQGACLTAEFVVRHPRSYGAVVIFTGGLIGPPGTRWPSAPQLRDVPVYITGSTMDEWVPPERVEETARVLESNGARVTLKIFDGREHHVCEEEIAVARALLAAW